jgi:hypothetical protein
MIADVLARFRTLRAAWEMEVQNRHRRTTVDPGADTITSCASELEAVIRDVEQSTTYLSPDQYAALPGVATSAQTVRRWCRLGWLAGAYRKGGDGEWQIPRDAKKDARTARRGTPRPSKKSAERSRRA